MGKITYLRTYVKYIRIIAHSGGGGRIGAKIENNGKTYRKNKGGDLSGQTIVVCHKPGSLNISNLTWGSKENIINKTICRVITWQWETLRDLDVS